MKNRSLILGACAIIFASASAFTFADSKSLATVYVQVKTTANTNWHCENTTLACTNTGNFLCAVNVTRDIPTPATVIKTNGRTDVCVAQVNSTETILSYNPPAIVITDVMPFDEDPF